MYGPIGNDRANQLLAHLSARDFALLANDLMSTELPLRKVLEARGRRIEHVYFIEKGYASVVAKSSGLNAIEVGIIGSEGVTGQAVLMATNRSPHETYIQSAGHGQRISVPNLRAAMEKSSTLRNALLRFNHTFLVQVSSTALANCRSRIDERLARWLLMAHDRTENNDIVLTHELLSVMLGVRRPRVTVAMAVLERQGLIRPGRGLISIVDRKGLEIASKGSYGLPEAELRRVFNVANPFKSQPLTLGETT